MTDQAKILVVDDEDIVLISIRRILSKEGFAIETVSKALDGLEKASSGDFDLVITDLMMPEMNGIELMHAVREKGLETPFLMVTGYPTIKTAMQALRLGAVDYIPKPFTRVELLSPVNRALKRKAIHEHPQGETAKSGGGPVMPGDRFVLPEHSWALYEQDGTMQIGIEDSFLEGAGEIEKIELPAENEMVEQRYPTIRLKTRDGNEHGVFSPFSGRVMGVNKDALSDLAGLGEKTWLFRIIPSNLDEEREMLVNDA